MSSCTKGSGPSPAKNPGLRVATAPGEASTGRVDSLDELVLSDATIPAPALSLGVAPVGTPEGEVAFDTPLSAAAGAFEAVLNPPPPAGTEVWVRACVGVACSASRVVAP